MLLSQYVTYNSLVDVHDDGARLCYVSERRQSTSLSFIHQVIYEYGQYGGIILTGKTGYMGRNLTQCHFVHHKSHVD
jgi:hypothetical protein